MDPDRRPTDRQTDRRTDGQEDRRTAFVGVSPAVVFVRTPSRVDVVRFDARDLGVVRVAHRLTLSARSTLEHAITRSLGSCRLLATLQPAHIVHTVITRMALSTAHTSAKTADVAKLLLLNAG